MIYLLDTDHISLLDRGGHEGQTILARLNRSAPNSIVACAISLEEQTRGWLASMNSLRRTDHQVDGYRRLVRLLDTYCGVPVLPFDDEVAALYDRLRRVPIRIGTMDLKIAATALANKATLLTRNRTDFEKVPDLRVEDWSM